MLAFIDRVTDAIGAVCTWLTPLMVLLTVVVVVLRYALETSAIALQETVLYVHGLVFMLALGYALRHDAHVRVDVLYSRFSQRSRAIVNVVGHVLFLLPVALFIAWNSLNYVQSSWRVMEGSPEVGGLPFVYLLKTLIPLSALLLALQGCAEIAHGVQTLRADPQPRNT